METKDNISKTGKSKNQERIINQTFVLAMVSIFVTSLLALIAIFLQHYSWKWAGLFSLVISIIGTLIIAFSTYHIINYFERKNEIYKQQRKRFLIRTALILIVLNIAFTGIMKWESIKEIFNQEMPESEIIHPPVEPDTIPPHVPDTIPPHEPDTTKKKNEIDKYKIDSDDFKEILESLDN